MVGRLGREPAGALIMGKITLIFLFGSLIFAIFSLLIFLGNFVSSHCGTPGFGWDFGSKTAEIAKFRVNYPVSRESPVETGSYLTGHTPTQSSRTAETVVDQKQAVSAGILDAYFESPVSAGNYGLS